MSKILWGRRVEMVPDGEVRDTVILPLAGQLIVPPL
jgi:hypothetical protein